MLHLVRSRKTNSLRIASRAKDSAFIRAPRFLRAEECGFTLIELLAVVVVIALIAGLSAGRIESVVQWRQNSAVRRFLNTWQFVYNESLRRREAYRLVLNFDDNSYLVLREVRDDNSGVRNVDYLKNLRLKSERERRAKKEQEQLSSLDEEFAEEDARQSGALDSLFYLFLFSDKDAPSRLSRPLEFPSLSDPIYFPAGLTFRDLRVGGELTDSGQAFVRLSPRGGSDFSVIHLNVGDNVVTVTVNPISGETKYIPGDVDFEWTFAKNAN